MRSSYTALYEFGYSFLSPIMNHYVRKIAEYSIEQRPVCLAREGWLFFELINRVREKKLLNIRHEPVYLKVSRTLLFRSMLGDLEVWQLALENKFKGNVLDLMIKRFGLQLHEAYEILPAELLSFKVALPEEKDKVVQWLTPHKSRMQDHVEPTRRALFEYLSRTLAGEEHLTPLMLDLGYAGTIQKIITRIIKRDTSGLYFIANKSGNTQVAGQIANMRGVFKEDISWSQGYLMLERSLLLESLVTAPHGQVSDIRLRSDGNFDFFYGRSAAPQRYAQDLEAIMKGAIAGVEEGLTKNIEYNPEEIEALYAGFALSPSAIPKAAFHLFSIDDDFSGLGIISPAQLFGL